MPYLSREQVCVSPLRRMISPSLRRARRMAVAAAAVLLGTTGCYRTRLTSTTTEDFGYERRTPKADGEGISSEWQAEDGRVTGKVDWGSCRVERMSYRVVEVTRWREPDKLTGYLLLGGGVLSTALGLALWNASGSCPSGGCSGERNSTFLVLGLGAGLPTMGVGAATLLGKVSVTAEKGERQEDVKDEIGSCIQPRDLAELALVLEVEAGKTLPVRISEDGSAVIEVPAGSALPQGVDLPVVVQRAPRRAGDILSRSQVIGTVRLGDDAAAAP